MTTYHITPKSNCEYCHGRGYTEEHHSWGSTFATEYLTCDCVFDQLPEEFDDRKDEIDIESNEPDDLEFEYA